MFIPSGFCICVAGKLLSSCCKDPEGSPGGPPGTPGTPGTPGSRRNKSLFSPLKQKELLKR